MPDNAVTSLAGTVWPVVSSVTQWAAVRICVGSITTPPQNASVPAAGPSGRLGVWTNSAAWKGKAAIDGDRTPPTMRCVAPAGRAWATAAGLGQGEEQPEQARARSHWKGAPRVIRVP